MARGERDEVTAEQNDIGFSIIERLTGGERDRGRSQRASMKIGCKGDSQVLGAA